MAENPLGKNISYPERYDPDLLLAIPREDNRNRLFDVGGDLPFTGADIWRHYEVSWLDSAGKPEVGIATIIVPCQTPNIIESKSMKMYFNSLNQEKIADEKAFMHKVSQDLSRCAGATVKVNMESLLPGSHLDSPRGKCLDAMDISMDQYTVNADLLNCQPRDEEGGDQITEEALYTNLFKSNCPVTGQPDWATISISYRGKKIDQEGLLSYLVSYRQHSDYHENCVERIFMDISTRCRPEILAVEANFLRRGGLEINPVRTSVMDQLIENLPRMARQ